MRPMRQQHRSMSSVSGFARVGVLEVQQEALSNTNNDAGYGEDTGPHKQLPLYLYLVITPIALGLIAFAGREKGRTGSSELPIALTGFGLLLGEYALLLSGY